MFRYLPVSVSGCYWSGSTAVVDLLEEHEKCNIVKGDKNSTEFILYSYGQFFDEIYKNIINKNFDEKTKNENLLRFKSFNKNDFFFIRKVLRKYFLFIRKYPSFLFIRRMGMYKKFGEKYQFACEDVINQVEKAFLNKDLNIQELNESIQKTLYYAAEEFIPENLTEDSSISVFDQLISPTYTKYALKVLPKLKLIFVDRNWRDQYVELRKYFFRMVSINNSIGLRPFDEDLNDYSGDFINFFIKLRKKINILKAEQINIQNIFWLNFEDLIFRRDATSAEIFEFLGLTKNGWNKGVCFDPDASSNNVDIWQKSEYLEEILYLEKKYHEFKNI